MFSNNNRISTRQVFRLFVFDFVGESTLILPSQLAAFAGNDGLASIVLGGIMGSLYLWYLAYVLKKMETDLVTYMERILPAWMKKILLVLLLVYFTGMAGYGAYIFSDVIQKGLIAGESFPLILILVLLTAGYAVCGGIESRARVYEILFVVLFVLLAVMLLIAAGDLEMEYLYGFFQADTGSVMKGSLAVFFCLMPLFLLAFFPSYVQKAKWGKLVHAVHGNVVCHRCSCSFVCDPAGQFWKPFPNDHEISGNYADEQYPSEGKFFEAAGCLYDRHLVFYAVCTCDCVFVLCTGTGTETAEKRYA